MAHTAPVPGLLAGVVGIADTIPYVRDTVRGSTRPHRGTWLIWSVLAIVVCLSKIFHAPWGGAPSWRPGDSLGRPAGPGAAMGRPRQPVTTA
jgi:hypothetical protein